MKYFFCFVLERIYFGFCRKSFGRLYAKELGFPPYNRKLYQENIRRNNASFVWANDKNSHRMHASAHFLIPATYLFHISNSKPQL